MAHDYSGDMVVALRWVEPGEPPPLPLNGSRVLPLAFGADRVWREVVELLTETNAEDS